MTLAIVIAGTGTDVGKTIFAAAFTAALGASYWKPVQAGLDGESDSDMVLRLGGIGPERIVPEAYRLTTPASPHHAAARDGIEIDVRRLTPARLPHPLLIETAGGLMVPLTRSVLQIDVIASWKLPVVLVAATRLGTINHTLLSIEACKRRGIPLLGVAFVGEEEHESMRIIGELGGVKVLGRLPLLDPLTAGSLRTAFDANFKTSEILGLDGGGP